MVKPSHVKRTKNEIFGQKFVILNPTILEIYMHLDTSKKHVLAVIKLHLKVNMSLYCTINTLTDVTFKNFF